MNWEYCVPSGVVVVVWGEFWGVGFWRWNLSAVGGAFAWYLLPVIWLQDICRTFFLGCVH